MQPTPQNHNRYGRCTRGSVLGGEQRGFTLIELMVVVAIIGVLASLAVVMFGGESKKVKAKTEVTAMFAEMQVRQNEYRVEAGAYLSTNAANDEADTWPAAPSTDGSKQSLLPYPANWSTLRIKPDAASVRCAYVMIAGEGGDDTNVGTIAANDFNYVPPAIDWYYMLAHCDMDQDATTDSYYFQRSDDDRLYFLNQGN